MKKLLFMNVARFVRAARTEGKPPYSQSDMAHLLGMTNGQFVSNIERGLCSIPPRYILRFCRITKTSPDLMVEAILADHREALYSEINKGMLDEDRSVPTV